MRAHLAYLRYVLRHKWFVFVGCKTLGVSLWQAVIHDWTKFTPAEWGPYVRQFYQADGTKRRVRDTNGSYDPNAQSEEFKRAWLHHQRQPHHWQAWLSIGDGGGLEPLAIPQKYVLEMVADWYEKQKDKMILEEGTRRRIEQDIPKVGRIGTTSPQD